MPGTSSDDDTILIFEILAAKITTLAIPKLGLFRRHVISCFIKV